MKSNFFWIGYCEATFRIWGVIPLERSPVNKEMFMVENKRGAIQWKSHYMITRYATISGKVSKKLEIKFHDQSDIIDAVCRRTSKGYMPVDLRKLHNVHFFFPNFKKNLKEAAALALNKG